MGGLIYGVMIRWVARLEHYIYQHYIYQHYIIPARALYIPALARSSPATGQTHEYKALINLWPRAGGGQEWQEEK